MNAKPDATTWDGADLERALDTDDETTVLIHGHEVRITVERGGCSVCEDHECASYAADSVRIGTRFLSFMEEIDADAMLNTLRERLAPYAADSADDAGWLRQQAENIRHGLQPPLPLDCEVSG
jgi:hypothetical protein